MGLFDLFKKKQGAATTQVDYSIIDSNEKARALFENGQLAKLYLMPLDFGGQDSPVNILFVPEFANVQKNNFDAKIYTMLERGMKLGYSANPEYKGKSFIPSKITINVKGDQTMTEVIDIW